MTRIDDVLAANARPMWELRYASPCPFCDNENEHEHRIMLADVYDAEVASLAAETERLRGELRLILLIDDLSRHTEIARNALEGSAK